MEALIKSYLEIGSSSGQSVNRETMNTICKLSSDATGSSALHISALIDDENYLSRLLLDHDSSFMNSTNKYGETPLHYCAQKDNADLAHILLVLGANIVAKDNGTCGNHCDTCLIFLFCYHYYHTNSILNRRKHSITLGCSIRFCKCDQSIT